MFCCFVNHVIMCFPIFALVILDPSVIMGQVQYHDASVPEFFIAEGPRLTKAASLALQGLGVEGTSEYMIVRDETSVAKSYNLVYGLCSDQPHIPHIIGGVHPGHAKIPAAKSDFENGGQLILEEDKLSPLSVFTCVKRLDCRSGLFAIQQVPRRGATSAEIEFEEIGLIAQSCASVANVILFVLCCTLHFLIFSAFLHFSTILWR